MTNDEEVTRVWEAAVAKLSAAAAARATGEVVDAWTAFLDALEVLGNRDPFTALILAHGCIGDLQDPVVTDLVTWSRRAGESWEDIGHATGVTKAGAHRKWRHLEDEK